MVFSAETVLTVSEYLDALNLSLRGTQARIMGEISQVQAYPGRSYLYFSVKDSKDSSTIKCFMWKKDYTLSGVELVEGMEVIITAYPNVYKPNGGMTLQVESVELVGEGALKIAYEKLKAQLQSEGLFDQVRKKALPYLPHRIGILTSKSGAVINDFLSNIGKYGFEIIFVDSKVEGEGAVKDLLTGLRTLYTQKLDVLIIMRGGGSLESFQAFNNEALVRAITKFNIPVVTGIGHDKDVPLISLVSDINVSTPTAVANLLNETWKESIHTVTYAEQKIMNSLEQRIRDTQYTIERGGHILARSFSFLFDTFQKHTEAIMRMCNTIEFTFERLKSELVLAQGALIRGFERTTTKSQQMIDQYYRLISQNDPVRQLQLGWSISKDKHGKIIRSVEEVQKDEEVNILLADGILKTKKI